MTVAVVTNPIRARLFLRIAAMGSISLPLGRTLIDPLLTRCPPPHALDAAAESVTIELDDAVSIKPRAAFGSLSSDHQPVPRFRVSFE